MPPVRKGCLTLRWRTTCIEDQGEGQKGRRAGTIGPQVGLLLVHIHFKTEQGGAGLSYR